MHKRLHNGYLSATCMVDGFEHVLPEKSWNWLKFDKFMIFVLFGRFLATLCGSGFASGKLQFSTATPPIFQCNVV